MGFYVSVKPLGSVESQVAGLCAGISLPFLPLSELHCTVIYSLVGHRPKLDLVDSTIQQGPFRVRPVHVARWVDHLGRIIVVLEMVSQDLLMRHQEWSRLGFEPAFPVYSCHMTLTDFLTPEQDKKLADDLLLMNQKLAGGERWFFGPETVDQFEQESRPVRQISGTAVPTEGSAPVRLPLAASTKGLCTVKVEARKHKFPGLRGMGIALGPVPVTIPDLTEHEESAIQRYGFNAISLHGLKKRHQKREELEEATAGMFGKSSEQSHAMHVLMKHADGAERHGEHEGSYIAYVPNAQIPSLEHHLLDVGYEKMPLVGESTIYMKEYSALQVQNHSRTDYPGHRMVVLHSLGKNARKTTTIKANLCIIPVVSSVKD